MPPLHLCCLFSPYPLQFLRIRRKCNLCQVLASDTKESGKNPTMMERIDHGLTKIQDYACRGVTNKITGTNQNVGQFVAN